MMRVGPAIVPSRRQCGIFSQSTLSPRRSAARAASDSALLVSRWMPISFSKDARSQVVRHRVPSGMSPLSRRRTPASIGRMTSLAFISISFMFQRRPERCSGVSRNFHHLAGLSWRGTRSREEQLQNCWTLRVDAHEHGAARSAGQRTHHPETGRNKARELPDVLCDVFAKTLPGGQVLQAPRVVRVDGGVVAILMRARAAR